MSSKKMSPQSFTPAGSSNKVENFTEATPKNIPTNDFNPLFCFNCCQSGFKLEDLPKNDKIAFLSKIQQLSSRTWGELQQQYRSGHGYEKIKDISLKKPVPSHVPQNSIITFRLTQNGKGRILGFRNPNHQREFHIVWIDPAGVLYNH